MSFGFHMYNKALMGLISMGAFILLDQNSVYLSCDRYFLNML